MSSASRDEGGRSRRRRRRGGFTSSRPDSDHPPSARPPQRQQPYPQSNNPYIPQQPQGHPHRPRSVPNSLPSPPAPGRVRESENQRPSFPANGSQSSRDALTKSYTTSSAEKQLPLEAQRIKEEEEAHEREQKEKEARDQAKRDAQFAKQLAKRGGERSLNLAFRVPKNGDASRRERPSDSELRQLDSSLKKCTGFLRKIRSSGITEESVPALCQEAHSLNLSRYISEVVTAISEVKLKSVDVEHAVLLCGEFYRRYDDFVAQLVSALGTAITTSSSGTGARDLGTRRATMRLLVEMFVLGMTADVTPITNVLKQLVRGPKDSKEELLSNLSIIASFVRAGSRTLLPKKIEGEPGSQQQQKNSPSTTWEDEVLPQANKTTIFSALQSYYGNDVTRLFKESMEDLQRLSLALKRSKNARGDPDDAAASAYESAKQFHEKVSSSATVLAQALNKPPPDVALSELYSSGGTSEPGISPDAAQTVVVNPLHSLGKSRQVQEELGLTQQLEDPFDGEEERLFYTDLPHLRTHPLKNEGKSALDVSIDKASDGSNEKGSGEPQSLSKTCSPQHVDSKHAATSRGSVENRRRGGEKPITLEKLLGRLPTAESKENADSFVAQFLEVTEGSKNGPKRLAKSLYSVSAQKLNLLPAYTRIAACLHSTHSDIAGTVGSNLEDGFRYLVGRTDIDEKDLAACIKNAKYTGEYVKFGLLSTSTLFDLLTMCMKDFSGHRVDIACHLVETCGRFVYRTPSTHIRMGNILDTLWRLKSVKNLEARHNALVETAFFAARPSSANKLQKRKQRPPLHEYIRHLIYYRLEASNISWTCTQLLKLPWDEELEHYVIKKFVKISRARFSTIPYVATLISRLQTYKPGLVTGIVDALLESIRSGLEKNDGRDSQRRIAELKLLGELQKCGVVEEKVVYYVLYQSITLGHDSSDMSSTQSKRPAGLSSTGVLSDSEHSSQIPSGARPPNGTYTIAPDPAGDFFRIRLACVLLESCGRFLAASNRRKLEVFWVFFERYIFCKAFQAGLGDRVPLHISHVVGDAFEHSFQRERPVFRDNRIGVRKDAEVHSRRSTRQDTPRQAGRDRSFRRSETLAESLEAVQEVEKSPMDSSLICVPVRYILRSSSNKQGQAAHGTDINLEGLNATPASDQRGLGGAASEPVNNKTGDRGDTLSDEEGAEDEEAEEQDGSEQLTDDLLSNEMDENETVVDGEEALSLESTMDDVDEEDEDDVNDGNGDFDGNDDDDEDDDDEGRDDDDDDDDDDSFLDVKVQRPKTEEEDVFSKELAAFTAEAVQTARASSSRVTKFDRMTIPMGLMSKKMEEERAAAAAAAANIDQDDFERPEEEGRSAVGKWKRRQKRGTGEHAVEFKMLVRKGGKSQLHDLQVPSSSSLAQAAKENETADAARHAETKRLVLESSIVLNHEEDLEEEVPLRTPQNVRDKEESIRQQRSEDERELLSTLYRNRPRR